MDLKCNEIRKQCIKFKLNVMTLIKLNDIMQ